MAKELAAQRVGDDSALVADDGIVEPCLLEVGLHAAEHPSGHDDHVRAPRAHGGDRLAGARAEHGILCEQRPVEVDRERGDALRERVGKVDQGYGGVPPVAFTTYEATSAICWSDN